jgi:hypothetical protein
MRFYRTGCKLFAEGDLDRFVTSEELTTMLKKRAPGYVIINNQSRALASHSVPEKSNFMAEVSLKMLWFSVN